MPLDKDKIIQHLEQQKEYIIEQGIKEDRIVGIFLYGSQNYGFANKDSDIDSKVIIVPNFSDFCLEPQSIVSKEYHYDKGDDSPEHIEVKDIRLMRKMYLKQNINFVETLFTDYYILNPMYEKIFNAYFMDNNELIAHYDMKKAVKSIRGQVVHSLNHTYSHKVLYNACRLYIFMREYMKGKSFLDCIRPKGTEWVDLWNLKYAQTDVSRDYEAIHVLSQEVKEMVADFVDDSAGDLPDADPNAKAVIDKGTIELCRMGFGDFNYGNIRRKDFLNLLTRKEKQAYDAVLKTLQAGNGVVVTASLMEKCDISRSTFERLFQKMRDEGVADIIPLKGNQGTRIRILQPEILQEAIDYSKEE